MLLGGVNIKIYKRISNYSDIILNKISNILSSKITFIVFCIIAFVPLYFKLPSNILDWQQWISQTMIQLIALNVLGYTTKNEGKKTQKTLYELHNSDKEERKILQEIISKQQELISESHQEIINLNCLISKQQQLMTEMHEYISKNKME